jgi:hypothetical protein
MSDASLHAADSAAIDALFDASFQIHATPSEHRPRADAAARLLSVLRAGASPARTDDLLIHATLSRVARARRAGPAMPAAFSADDSATLTPDDAEALDALIAADYAVARVPDAMRPRATRVAELLGVLDTPQPASAGTDHALIRRTIDLVQRAVDDQERRLTLDLEAQRAGFRRPRLSDIIAVAAMLFIAVAVLGPTLGFVREQQRRTACQSNMLAAGLGFGLYAGDNKDSLPMASASLAGTPWWFVGQPDRSNSANLYTITRTGYVNINSLACAGNEHAANESDPTRHDWKQFDNVSYSFQNLFAAQRPLWNGSVRSVVLSDRSPVVVRAFHGQFINPFANSLNHNERGQNILFNDGSVIWRTTPMCESGDNLWLPRDIEQRLSRKARATVAEPLKGVESPTSSDDAFVGPSQRGGQAQSLRPRRSQSRVP